MAMNSKFKKLLSYPVKILIIICTFWFIYKEVFENQNLESILNYFKSVILNPNNAVLFALVLLLMPLNWLLEAKKWQFLINKIERIDLLKSLQAVFAGLTISAFTPNRTGEFLGRITYTETADRIEASLITIIGSIGQFTITLLFGCIAAIWFLADESLFHLDSLVSVPLSVLLGAMCVMFPLVFLNTALIPSFFKQIPFLRKASGYVSVYHLFSISELLNVLYLSAFRYFVFTAQYLLLLVLFHVEISVFDAITGICLTFLVTATIPTAALYELGIREAVSLYILGVFSTNEIGIISASFCLWGINIAFPALLGSINILTARILKTRQPVSS